MESREFYKQGGKLKKLALSVYTEEELIPSITERIIVLNHIGRRQLFSKRI